MTDQLHDSRVAIAHGLAEYPRVPPYSPNERYPEYPFSVIQSEPNPAYALVRESLRLLELDKDSFDTARWNPFRDLIQPGQTVVLKPNLVRDRRETLPGLDDCTITHGSVIRAVLDYVYIALAGRGRIVIADAPMDDADWQALDHITGLSAMAAFYRQHADFNIEIIDLRLHRDHKINGLIVGRDNLPGDPAGYVWVDLGEHSAFHEIEHLCHKLYGATYDVAETRRHHTGGRHEYLVSKTVLGAACVIEIPKLKTHQKTGITCNLKLLVGIVGDKDCIAHYRLGVPADGGDQFAGNSPRERIERGTLGLFKRVFPRLGPLRRAVARPARRVGELLFGRTGDVVRSGNWHGNDTAWRMTHDLMRIVLYADKVGCLQPRPARRLFSVVDAIIAGQGNGPLDATPCRMSAILGGMQPAAVDLVCARLMNFDDASMPLLAKAFDQHPMPLSTAGRETAVLGQLRIPPPVGVTLPSQWRIYGSSMQQNACRPCANQQATL